MRYDIEGRIFCQNIDDIKAWVSTCDVKVTWLRAKIHHTRHPTYGYRASIYFKFKEPLMSVECYSNPEYIRRDLIECGLVPEKIVD